MIGERKHEMRDKRREKIIDTEKKYEFTSKCMKTALYIVAFLFPAHMILCFSLRQSDGVSHIDREREERREDIRNTLYNMFLSESEIQILVERIENERDSKR